MSEDDQDRATGDSFDFLDMEQIRANRHRRGIVDLRWGEFTGKDDLDVEGGDLFVFNFLHGWAGDDDGGGIGTDHGVEVGSSHSIIIPLRLQEVEDYQGVEPRNLVHDRVGDEIAGELTVVHLALDNPTSAVAARREEANGKKGDADCYRPASRLEHGVELELDDIDFEFLEVARRVDGRGIIR